MVAAVAKLKSVCPELFRVACVAQLIPKCAIKVKPHFEDVDQLIAKFKSATVKSNTRRAKFAIICW